MILGWENGSGSAFFIHFNIFLWSGWSRFFLWFPILPVLFPSLLANRFHTHYSHLLSPSPSCSSFSVCFIYLFFSLLFSLLSKFKYYSIFFFILYFLCYRLLELFDTPPLSFHLHSSRRTNRIFAHNIYNMNTIYSLSFF